MRRNSLILRIFIIANVLIPVLFIAAKNLPAGFSSSDLKTRVEIDGINYGVFDKIEGFDLISGNIAVGDSVNGAPYYKVRLTRDFVTDRSLYLWAMNRMSRKTSLKNINLITEDENGNAVSRYVLELCQPLSWTVETTNPSLGGFNETIDLAVQKITEH